MKRLGNVLIGCMFVIGSLAACSGASATPTSGTPLASPSFDGPVSTVSINAGGPATGDFWADQFFSGGATYTNHLTIDTSQLTSSPPPAAIFGTERYGAMTYTIPSRSGAQMVTLYFAETYVSGPGERLFDVTINGTTVLSSFDIYASAGGPNRAIAKTFTAAADSSGQVVIKFITGTQNPKINGITVTGGGTTATPPPATPTPTSAAPPTNSADAKLSAGCGKSPHAAERHAHHREQRHALVHPPRPGQLRLQPPLPAHPGLPLVLRHGAGRGRRAAGPPRRSFYGLWDLAVNSTIFVAPMGLGSASNTGWPNANGEDVAFTDAILAQVEAALCIDTTRIFATGFSYGAGMSYALACARPDVFRGVALYSGAMLSACDGSTKPIAFFASHGIGDSVLDISQGRPLRDHFVQVNGVTPQNPPEPAAGSGDAHLHQVPGRLSQVPGRMVRLRRRPHSEPARQRSEHQLDTCGSLGLHQSVLISTRARRPARKPASVQSDPHSPTRGAGRG